MSERKWTKGPWFWNEDRWNGGYSSITGADDVDVLRPNHCNDGDDGAAWFEDYPSDADRALIVSAPDLFEALEAILPYAANMLEHDHPVVAKARAALQRAEGEAQ